MSISVTSSPSSYIPSDNDIIWQFTSTNTGQANFSFFIEVYIDGILRGSHIVFPERSNKGKFNASDTARLYCSKPVIPSAWADDASNHVDVYIKIWERYGDPAENQGSATTSSTVTAWKARLTDEQWVAYIYSEYVFASNSKFLTYFPRTKRMKCRNGEKLFLSYINDGLTTPELQVFLYDASDVIINTDSIGLPSSGELITIFNASIDSIIANSSLTQSNFDAASYYGVRVSNGVSTHSEIIKIDIDNECQQYTSYRLHFLNKLGGMDSLTFSLASTQSREVQSFGYQKQFGGWNSSNNFVYDLTEGREQQIIKISSGKMTISSDWLSENIQNWVSDELYESPFVLMEMNNTLRRVNILNSQYVLKQTITDQLFQEIVEINLSDARKSTII